ncbi:ABC transporter ATP-binding protein, partial [Rubrivirga sp.]|uniref:ABC transporter ATP-binding protein n=1 Tax=Rubrivirga sp. TaxID=1885344 RepID=UPI003C75CCA0
MWPEPSSITLSGVGKKFTRQWILREYSDQFISGVITGVRGRNGSGKSTLLRLLAGQLTPSRGSVVFRYGNQPVAPAEHFRHVRWAGPYFELPEELTIAEFLKFHFTQKAVLKELGGVAQVQEFTGLGHVRNRQLLDCSSGMRQRILLASALYSATPVLLLDEPTVTLDEAAARWFQ